MSGTHHQLIPMFLTTVPVPTRWHPSPRHPHVSDYRSSTHEVAPITASSACFWLPFQYPRGGTHHRLIRMFLTTVPVPTRWHPSPPHPRVSDYRSSTHEVIPSTHTIHSDVTWQVRVIYNLWDGFCDACDNSTVTNERSRHILSVQLSTSHSPWTIVNLRSHPTWHDSPRLTRCSVGTKFSNAPKSDLGLRFS